MKPIPSPSETPGPTTLSLGVLFRNLRGGVGDEGSARVSIRFEQRASQGGSAVPVQLTKTSLRAELDFRDGSLLRADMMSTSSHNPAHLRVTFLGHQDGYLYSLDGIHFGPFAGPVVLFDIGSFEELLAFVHVRDVTIDERRDARGATLDVLDVDLDTEGFRRLLRVFGSDTEETPEEFDLDSYSVNLTAGGDLIVDYWWQLSGDHGGESSSATTINCHVTIRLVAITAIPEPDAGLDISLPLLKKIDDVWDLARVEHRDHSS